ncbi:HNH endonuclease [candidate division WOR-3 bacterium]|nr:HNH endonuclease [candidate division WOR-3 bacterium]
MNYTYNIILKVWEKAQILEGKNPALWRADDHGVLMYREHYGNHESIFGWEVTHIIPIALGGKDEISNLKPTHCRTRKSKRIVVGRPFWQPLRRKPVSHLRL